MNSNLVYPREGELQTVYLKSVVDDPNITIGKYSMYNDFCHDPRDFQKNNVLYHYPVNHDRLIMGRYCSVACGAKFIFNAANHTMQSLAAYPFSIFYQEWGLSIQDVAKAWDNKGDIVVGNDVWIGYESVILSGVTIGDGAIIGARALVTKDVPPYTIVGGIPAKQIKKRFDDATIEKLLKIRWWDWPDEKVKEKLPEILRGDICGL